MSAALSETTMRPPGFRGSILRGPEALPYASAAGPIRITPLAVATPADAADLALLVRWAADEGIPLVPRGAGTGMPGGNVGPGIVVHLGKPFAQVRPPDPVRRTLVAGAGAIAAAVDRAARAAGLFLPPLPSSADRCTIGGMIANNAAGARSFRYGATHAWVESLEAVLADGKIVTLSRDSARPQPFASLALESRPDAGGAIPGWPRVRKNASGYALDRYLATHDPVQLLVGSEGTLGFVVRATLRLAPCPPARALAAVAVPALDALADLAAAARELGAAACEMFGRRFLELASAPLRLRLPSLPAPPAALLFLELEGPRHEVDASLDQLARRARAFDAKVLRVAREPAEYEELWELRHAASPTIAAAAEQGRVSMQFIEDSVVPPEHLVAYIREVEAILDAAGLDAVIFGHAGDANVHVNPLVDVRRPDWRARVRETLYATAELVARLGGTLTGEHGDGRLRAPLLDRIWPASILRDFHSVKRVFDPAGILNPGVILPRPGQDPLDGLAAPPLP